MSSHQDSYINNWNRIHKQTMKIMAVAPSDKYDWRPAETAMTLGKLMNHLWISEWGLVEAAINGSLPAERPELKKNTEDLIATFDKSHKEMVAKVSTLTPEQLAEEISPFGADRKVTRKAVLYALHEHEIHHRGQLYVYLRILGCEIPPLYS
jgi:uncharacterized damage-inducible protein DinB